MVQMAQWAVVVVPLALSGLELRLLLQARHRGVEVEGGNGQWKLQMCTDCKMLGAKYGGKGLLGSIGLMPVG